MKILFIMAGDINYQSRGLLTRRQITNLEPLGLTILAALVPDELGPEIRIVDEGTEPGCYAGIIADMVGIYCCTSSAERAYMLCRYWKRKGAFVVLGGPHPTLCPEEAADYADAVAVGAAEDTWPRLLNDFIAGRAEKIYRQDPAVPLTSPVPRRDLVKRGYVRIPSVMANRGCNYTCDYCVLQNIWKGLPHKRPVGEVVEEIKRLKSKYMILLDPIPSPTRRTPSSSSRPSGRSRSGGPGRRRSTSSRIRSSSTSCSGAAATRSSSASRHSPRRASTATTRDSTTPLASGRR